MPRFLPLLSVACLCAIPWAPLPAAALAGPVELNATQSAQAAKQLASDVPVERESAYKSFRALGESVRPAYKLMLEKARAGHEARLKSRISTSLPALKQFAADTKTWTEARDACLKPLYEKTDHDKGKLADLARVYAAAEKTMKDLSRNWKRVPDGINTWETSADAMNEISGELAWCQDAPADDTAYFRDLSAKERATEVTGGAEFLELIPGCRERLQAQKELQVVTNFNEKEIRWPAPALKSFMLLINQRRYVLGMPVLRLDERLSQCAKNHSDEMQRLKYFAHESPVPENKTPWDRAKNAKFEGQCTGENIFMGSASPDSAFHAWWESDGHRFIMFQKDANTLGLGVVGVHWTLNTGNRDWSAAAIAAAASAGSKGN